MFSSALAFLLLAAMPVCSTLPWGFVDLQHQYDPSIPLHVRRSLCSDTQQNLYPAFVTSAVQQGDDGFKIGKYTTNTERTDPAYLQRDPENSITMFIWPKVDHVSSLSLDKCGNDVDNRLCQVADSKQAGLDFFDATPIYRSNEFDPNNTRLIVSSERVDVSLIASPEISAIGREVCGNEKCLPYFMYVENYERCQVGCRPIDPAQRRNSQFCNDPVKPICQLLIDGKPLFSSDLTGNGLKEIKLTFPEFTPLDIALRCRMPPGRKIVLCPDEPTGICDPFITVKKNDQQIFHSTNRFFIRQPGHPNVTVKIEGRLLLWIKLQFSQDLFNRDLKEASLFNGVYSFSLDFEGISVFNPHLDDIPLINVVASSNMPYDYAGINVGEKPGCRLTSMGSNYQGTQDVDQCQPTKSCINWQSYGITQYQNPASELKRLLEWNGATCRNPPAVDLPSRVRPWCYTGTTQQEWAYCDVPFCDSSIEFPEGYERFNRDCPCSGGYAGPAINDANICKNFCDDDINCQGFVIDERGVCMIKTCRCDDSQMTCQSQEAKLYYRRVAGFNPKPVYPDGLHSILVQVHNIEDNLKFPVNISCALFERRNSFEGITMANWQFYNESSARFESAANGGETKWISDSSALQFYLQIPQVTAAFNNRLYRCSRSIGSSEPAQYEYHFIRVFGMHRCDVRFNQDFYTKRSFVDRGIRLKIGADPKQRTTFELQLDLKCFVDRPLGRCVYWHNELCIPVVIVYDDGLPIVNSLQYNNTGLGLNYTFSFDDVNAFYLSVYLPNVDPTPQVPWNDRELSVLFYYPQLQQSHFTILNLISTMEDFDAIRPQIPPFPLTPALGQYKITCHGTFDFDGYPVSAERMAVAIHAPTAFVVNFTCQLNNKLPSAAFCFYGRSGPCFPVNLILRKDNAEIYTASWKAPLQDNWMDARTDGQAVPSPRFGVFSDKPDELTLQMCFTADPVDLTNVRRREELIMGSYSLAFRLDVETSQFNEHSAGVSLDIVPSTDFLNGTGFCQPKIGMSLESKWAYEGFEVNSGRCSKRQCLSWTTPELAGKLKEFEEEWRMERPQWQYEFNATESLNYCRNPSPRSIAKAPFCAVGITNNNDNPIEWDFCEVPVCQDVSLSADFYRRIPGRCVCNPTNVATDGPLVVDVERVPDDAGVEYCRKQCDNRPTCLGFNFEVIHAKCEFKYCQCFENDSSSVDCQTSLSSLWHYFNRTNESRSDLENFQHPKTESEIRFHPVQLGYSPFRVTCGMKTVSKEDWKLYKGGKMYLHTDNVFQQLGIEVYADRNMAEIYKISTDHDNIVIQCNSGDKFQAHVIQVQQPPRCTLSVYYGGAATHDRQASASGYEVAISTLHAFRAETARLIMECNFGNQKFGYCGMPPECDGVICTEPLCNPEVKVFKSGTRIFRTSLHGTTSSDTNINVVWTRARDMGENNWVNLTFYFNNFFEARAFSVGFSVLPRTQLYDDRSDEKIAQFVVSSAQTAASTNAVIWSLLLLMLSYL